MAERRFDVKLTHESPEHRDIHTFTWGDTYEEAVRRMEQGTNNAPEIWEGWTFEVTDNG